MGSRCPYGGSAVKADERPWFGHTRRVAWTDVDPSANYQFTAALRYAEEAEIAWLRELGVLHDLYPHLPRTFVEAQFRSPARFDEEVTVEIRLRRVGRSSIEYEFRLRQGERICAEGALGSALLAPDGQPVPVPARVRELLTGTTTGEEAHDGSV